MTPRRIPDIKTIAIVGCGGVTSHIIPALMHSYDLVLIDGDTFEPKNTLRQIGAHVGDGKNKAETYVSMFGKFTKKSMTAIPMYVGSQTEIQADLLIVAVDNNDARIDCKDIANRLDIAMIWGANEEFDPQAMLYLPEYEGTDMDPFVRWNMKPDGRSPMAACTTQEAVENNVQLPSSNHIAGGFALWLLQALLNVKYKELLPLEVIGRMNEVTTRKVHDLMKDAPAFSF